MTNEVYKSFNSRKKLDGDCILTKFYKYAKEKRFWFFSALSHLGRFLHGFFCIIKSLALSKIIFSSSVLNVPTGFVDQVNKSLSNFIWNHKPPKIKRSTMIERLKDGGLSMPDFDIIDTYLKAEWAKRILVPQLQSWKTIPFSLLHSVV